MRNVKQILVALGLVVFLAGCGDGGNENTGGAGGEGAGPGIVVAGDENEGRVCD